MFDLPTSKDQLISLLNTITSNRKQNTLIALQRIRDFYNPLVAENKHHEDDFKRFVLSMLYTYVDSSVDKKYKKSIGLHLQELASVQENFAGHVFVNYLRVEL